MGYLYLGAALIAGIIKGFGGKHVSHDVTCFKECIFINLLRMLFCAIIGFLLAIVGSDMSELQLTGPEISVCILAGVSMSIFCVCWMYAYRTEAYIFLSVFTMISSVVTCILDALIYNTVIRPMQWVGMLILFAAVYIMSVYNKGIKGKLNVKDVLILVLGCIGAAFADFAQKVYVRSIGKSADVLNFYMYAFSFLLLLLVYLASCFVGSSHKLSAKLYDRRHMLVYFAISFFLYLNSISKTVAASYLSSAQLYPVLQGANLILSALMAHILFKEKINLKGACGMLTAFVGVMSLNLL